MWVQHMYVPTAQRGAMPYSAGRNTEYRDTEYQHTASGGIRCWSSQQFNIAIKWDPTACSAVGTTSHAFLLCPSFSLALLCHFAPSRLDSASLDSTRLVPSWLASRFDSSRLDLTRLTTWLVSSRFDSSRLGLTRIASRCGVKECLVETVTRRSSEQSGGLPCLPFSIVLPVVFPVLPCRSGSDSRRDSGRDSGVAGRGGGEGRGRGGRRCCGLSRSGRRRRASGTQSQTQSWTSRRRRHPHQQPHLRHRPSRRRRRLRRDELRLADVWVSAAPQRGWRSDSLRRRRGLAGARRAPEWRRPEWGQSQLAAAAAGGRRSGALRRRPAPRRGVRVQQHRRHSRG